MNTDLVMENKIKVGDLQNIALLSIEQINNHPDLDVFYVASYQRGYRWGKEEVEYLLNDINDIASDKKYCIQPLTVTKKDDKVWELIDGQQRATTLFLIQTVLKNSFNIQTEPYYNLDYNTRSATRDFLIELREKDILKSYLGDNLDEKWELFITTNPEKDNIDNYHIFRAYVLIYNWLSNKSDELQNFYYKLTKQTYIIWHPIDILSTGQQTVEDFFINMNGGKIKLTSAELIKALFIIDIEKSDAPWDIRDFKKKKLAGEWDSIENDLHNDTFWYFINNNDEQVYPTRIGKLFDIHCKKTTDESELYAYYQYSEGKNNDGADLDWKKIKQIYQRLKEWYEDIKIYHLIGFIINAKFMTLQDIIASTEGKTKLEIEALFVNKIIEKFAVKNKKDNKTYQVYSLENLRYDTSYQECKNTLLLYNIKLIENTFPNQRFPFDLYQNTETQWSIEHIHPQNPQLLKSKEDAIEWLNDYDERYKEEGIETDKIATIAQLLKELQDLKDNTLTIDLSNKIKVFSETVNDALGLHQIGNQALLDKNINSKIGNKSFLKKRNIILNESKLTKDTYIPLGTINNFLKKTTQSGANNNIKVSYWSMQDSEDYTEDIKHLLTEFLPKNND